jgi:hypothetical protein
MNSRRLTFEGRRAVPLHREYVRAHGVLKKDGGRMTEIGGQWLPKVEEYEGLVLILPISRKYHENFTKELFLSVKFKAMM